MLWKRITYLAKANNTINPQSKNNMNYIVTGANSGLGLDTARQLALMPHTKMVYLACRTEAKALKAIDDIVRIGKAPKSKLTFLYFDASADKDTIERSILGSLPSGETINGLILNAGGVVSQRHIASIGAQCL